jgi:2-polyprenyl-3-methyl-5-hydroxy-6-metoxy-1,4-benzoquinol methylase
MPFKVKIAKKMMKLMPNKPIYGRVPFQQEYFRHPNFISLDEEQKKKTLIKFVHSHYIEDQNRPLDLFSPRYILKKLKGAIVLDLGCSLGGKSVSCAERWNIKAMYGIDVNKQSIEAANLFIYQRGNRGIYYDFRVSCTEDLPFGNDTFDAIISQDTIEHVRSVSKTLSECKRALKPGGMFLCVFPSYKFPFGGAHISSATKTPFLEWFFKPSTLNMAYQEIIDTWGKEHDWYKTTDEAKESNWAELKAGIGINGIRYRQFKLMVEDIGFSKVEFIRTPLLSVSNTAIRYAIVKQISSLLSPLLKFEALVDYLSHRLVFVLFA